MQWAQDLPWCQRSLGLSPWYGPPNLVLLTSWPHAEVIEWPILGRKPEMMSFASFTMRANCPAELVRRVQGIVVGT